MSTWFDSGLEIREMMANGDLSNGATTYSAIISRSFLFPPRLPNVPYCESETCF
ncbi:hypothetical protein AVEN_147496-1 [Araneus ventricosus]|uniref:Uncharacterized protein n=1 Tax=Araneus ventricosus TaxID=182803 RepID=A0A4Y2B4J6_ARAVE|nr:hypothetical protein AVEN_147496-1 [Araneus ventricosus]